MISPPVIAEMIYGDFPQITEDLELSEGGLGELDSGSIGILAEWATRRAMASALGYTKNAAAPGFASLYVEGVDWKKSGSLAQGTVRLVGLETPGERRKRRLSVAGQEISVGPVERVVLVYDDAEQGEEVDGTPIAQVKRRVPKLDDEGEVVYKLITTPSGIFERWSISQAFLTVQDVYFTTTAPSTIQAGTAFTPPDAPTPPTYIWGSYGEEMRARHPNGWVLDSREIDPLFEGLWAVTDSYGFYYTALPD